MAIPTHTFVFPGCEYLKYPEVPPWTRTGQIPDHWFADKAGDFIYEKAHIIESAEPYELNSPPQKPGVYFLIRDDEILYVGMSTSIGQRLWKHRDKFWPFNRYWCFGGVPQSYIADIEAYYIHVLQPPLNGKFPILHATIRRLVDAYQKTGDPPKDNGEPRARLIAD